MQNNTISLINNYPSLSMCTLYTLELFGMISFLIVYNTCLSMLHCSILAGSLDGTARIWNVAGNISSSS